MLHEEEDEYFESNNFSGGEGSQAEEANDESDEKKVKKLVKVRTVVRKPQIKLDPSRVCGDRGLKSLMKGFEKFKYKEGNEFTDLNNMVSQFEYWAHRLYPRMKFKDVIERLEKLGEKREIRNQLHELRMGIDANLMQNMNAIDPAEDDERMTEHVMRMMDNIECSDEETDGVDRLQRSTANETKQQQHTKVNDDEDDDEDALFNKLLTENRI